MLDVEASDFLTEVTGFYMEHNKIYSFPEVQLFYTDVSSKIF